MGRFGYEAHMGASRYKYNAVETDKHIKHTFINSCIPNRQLCTVFTYNMHTQHSHLT